MQPGGIFKLLCSLFCLADPVRDPYSYLVPGPHRLFKNASTDSYWDLRLNLEWESHTYLDVHSWLKGGGGDQNQNCHTLIIFEFSLFIGKQLISSSKSRCSNLTSLKVVGNEKLGGLRFLQLLGIRLGPWRLMSIFILNMPFANAKRISVSALSSKMNRGFVCK